MSDTMGIIIIIGVAIILTVMSDFQAIKTHMPVFRAFWKETKRLNKEAISELFQPLKWLKVYIWNRNLKIVYHRIRIRFSKNEFDESSNLDTNAMEHMNKKELEKYTSDVFKRQRLAHEKDLEKS